ncbi:hypothetical protein CAEBREN_23388 [Caenorhabditis brenneri]|uniref:Uncharacterized protein n=1 Tax=Caenorhabditis brenneri TaxID=135651 RepID=G0MLL6_CAEBE|nr:hypothetical protein CAEBREN_23388 [Caenorhabditis brenneri]
MAYHQLPKLTALDFEVTYFGNSSSTSPTGSSAATSPSSSSSSSSKTTDRLAAAPDGHFLQKKRTQPIKYCPKQRTATKRFQPANSKDNKVPKVPYTARPLKHIVKRQLVEPENNPNMAQYRAYRQLEMQKAQAAKLTKGLEEPSMKKRAPLRRKEAWERNY